ncbi:MAG TPA: hypothetical protein VIF15_09595 [Polyangiaceae bacterium]|jgi:hypothetical protein
MSRDELLAGGVILSFATLVTAHVTLAVGLAARRPRWRALAALVVAPLAPYWGHREQMHARTAAWVAGAVAYAILRWLSSR